MKVALQTIGTEGDVRPFLALGQALAAHGHQVTLSFTAYTPVTVTRSHGVTIREIPPRARGGDLGELWHEMQTHASAVAAVRRISEEILWPILGDLHAEARHLCATSDVVVRHPTLYPAAFAARATATPLAVLQPAPLDFLGQVAPSGIGGGLRALRMRRGPVVGMAVDRILGLSRFRDLTGAPTPFHGQRLLTESDETIIAADPTLADTADIANLHTVGRIEPLSDRTAVPPHLEEFLDAGSRPILVNLGSIATVDAASGANDWILEAVARSGVRAVVQTDTGETALPPGLVRAGFVPYRELLPRVAGVVHHGGAGTTHAVVEAGRGSVVIPHFADQFFWAKRLEALGAGRTVDARRPDPGVLAREITRLHADEAMRTRVGRIAAGMVRDGRSRAVEIVENLRR